MSLKDKLKLGATGNFPRGKLRPEDEGELQLAVVNRGKTIEVHFGKPVTWVGFAPDDARNFAALLVKHADQIDGGGK